MQEFGFELALCRTLEPERSDRLYARQLGGGVHGRRVVDVVALTPVPSSTPAGRSRPRRSRRWPSRVGPGTAVRPADALDCLNRAGRSGAHALTQVTSTTQRKPMFPVELSASFFERAASL